MFRAVAARLKAGVIALALAGLVGGWAASAGVVGGRASKPLRRAVARTDLRPVFRLAEKGLRRHFPDWRVMRRGDFDAGVVRFAQKRGHRGEGPERCVGDFDGNGLMDVALVVRKGDFVRFVALNQTKPGQWEPHVLSGDTYRGGLQGGYKGFTIFLVRRGPGEIPYWPECANGPTGRFGLNHPGIEIVFAGKAASVYYWATAHYISMQTAD